MATEQYSDGYQEGGRMSTEATVKLALDDLISEYYMENSSFAKRVADIFKDTLAQPQQEPVAWIEEATVKLALGAITAYLSESPDPSEEAVEGLCDARAILRQALAKQPAPVAKPHEQEPVAYWIPKAEQFCIADPSGRPFAKAWEPLYTSPQPAQRKPLTKQEIRKWWASENSLEDCVMSKLDDFEQVVRAIEAAHNIKENT